MQRRSSRFARPVRGARGLRPSRLWTGVSGQFAVTDQVTTTAVPLISLQAPASLASLTSDPPEDLTILRMVGSFSVSLSAAGVWTLALTVADVTWTPGSTSLEDADKRLLWLRTFNSQVAATYQWLQPGYLTVNNTVVAAQVGLTDLDIAPKVKVEAGKALYLVAYEESGAAALTVASRNMRVLVQRTGR